MNGVYFSVLGHGTYPGSLSRLSSTLLPSSEGNEERLGSVKDTRRKIEPTGNAKQSYQLEL